jgi:hypothetical protein
MGPLSRNTYVWNYVNKGLQRSAVTDGLCSTFIVSQWSLNLKNTLIKDIHKNTKWEETKTLFLSHTANSKVTEHMQSYT